MFARSASDAILVVNLRQKKLSVRDHLHRFRRTMLGTGAAVGLLRFNNTVFLHELRFADLDDFLFIRQQRLNRACRADLSADGALESAIVDRVVHPGLHDPCNAILKE